MRATDLHPVIREALAVFETLRKLGFPADDIFIGHDPHTRHGAVYMQLKTQGKKFVISLDGPGNEDWAPAALSEAWTAAGRAYNGNGPDDFTDEERQWIWEESYAREYVVLLMAAIQAKGIALPSTWKGN